MVLTEAINRAGSTAPEAIRNALLATDLKPEQTIMPWKGVKFDQLYGQAGIPQAWLVDVGAASVEDYGRPLAQGYADVRSIRRGEQITLEAFPGLSLAVDDILG